jgi:predicted nucleotidyltransferase
MVHSLVNDEYCFYSAVITGGLFLLLFWTCNPVFIEFLKLDHIFRSQSFEIPQENRMLLQRVSKLLSNLRFFRYGLSRYNYVTAV